MLICSFWCDKSLPGISVYTTLLLYSTSARRTSSSLSKLGLALTKHNSSFFFTLLTLQVLFYLVIPPGLPVDYTHTLVDQVRSNVNTRHYKQSV